MATAACEGAAQARESLKDMNVTKYEFAKLEAAFQKPEFMELFSEYVKEISDPKAREENNAYIRQLELEGRVEEVFGKGVNMVIPEAEFVLKTVDVQSKAKVFINVCSSAKVEDMTMTQTTGPDGKHGTHVAIPMTYSKEGKKGTDRHGCNCLVWDLVVNPACIATAAATPRMMGTLAEMAIEKLEAAVGLKLSRNYKLPKMKYKATQGSDKPHVMAIRAENGTRGSEAGGDAPAPDATMGMRSRRDATSTAAAPGKAAARSRFAFQPPKQQKQQKQEPSGVTTPEWKLIHRGIIDLAETWGDVGRNLQYNTCLPKDLLLKVSLPGVTSAASIVLDVGQRVVVVTVEGRYQLCAPLPYKINDAKVKAKFDKQAHQLELTLSVLPPPLDPHESSTSAGNAAAEQAAGLAHGWAGGPLDQAANGTQPRYNTGGPARHPGIRLLDDEATATTQPAPAAAAEPAPAPAAAAECAPAPGAAADPAPAPAAAAEPAPAPAAAPEPGPAPAAAAAAVNSQPLQCTPECSNSALGREAQAPGGRINDGDALTENERKWNALHSKPAVAAGGQAGSPGSKPADPEAPEAPSRIQAEASGTDLDAIRDVPCKAAAGSAEGKAGELRPSVPRPAQSCSEAFLLKPRITASVLTDEID